MMNMSTSSAAKNATGFAIAAVQGAVVGGDLCRSIHARFLWSCSGIEVCDFAKLLYMELFRFINSNFWNNKHAVEPTR